MPFPRRDRRGESKTVRLFKTVLVPLNADHQLFPEAILRQPRMRYRALEDPLFPGTWRAEPVGYMGRGIIYLFRGKGARQEAEAQAAEINHRDGFA